MYCRYREISPVCVGKNRTLTPKESTKEHLIPKYLMKDAKFKARWSLPFNASDEPNVDISCYKCNNLKNQMADVPFAWKLQYLNKYGISIKSKRSLTRSLTFEPALQLAHDEKEKVFQCVLRGNFYRITDTDARFEFHHMTVLTREGRVLEVTQQKKKLPRKLKKAIC